MIVKFLHPNPTMRKFEAKRFSPLQMFENNTVAVMPYSYMTSNANITGLVGKLRSDYIYPYHVFFDIGCGQTVLEFEDLPDNVSEILKDIDLSEFNFSDIEDEFPTDLSSVENKISVEEIQKIYNNALKSNPDSYIQLAMNDFKYRFDRAVLMKESLPSTNTGDGNELRLFKQQSYQNGNKFELRWNIGCQKQS